MTTDELVTYLEELGYLVENDEFTVVVWYVFGRRKMGKAKMAWINKVHVNNYHIYGVGPETENKKRMSDVIHTYAQTSIIKRKNR